MHCGDCLWIQDKCEYAGFARVLFVTSFNRLVLAVMHRIKTSKPRVARS